MISNDLKLINPYNWRKLKVVAIVQARVGSIRFPNEVMNLIVNCQ